MGYFFEPHESLSTAVLRVAREQIEAAESELAASGPGRDERVHSVRKRTKKLRALLRLVRSSLGDSRYDTENAALRDAARLLASAREAAVLLATLDKLDPAGELADLRTLLGEIKSTSEEPHDVEALELFRAVRARLDEWALGESDWKLVGPGLREDYSRGRRAFARAYRDQTPEAFHEWRKSTKHHWYHVRLLSNVWPGPLGALERELHRLSELLGDEHDLADLEAALTAQPLGLIQREDRNTVLALLERRRQELRAQAKPLGTRVFAEPAKRLERRFRRYFEASRAET